MKKQTENGASAVEFALILPLLLVLTFGIIEFSVFLFDKAVITNASREGARFGIVFVTDGTTPVPKTDEEIQSRVMAYANNLLINLGPGGSNNLVAEDIVVTPALRSSGEDLIVQVTYTYNFLIFPNLTALLGGSFSGSKDLVGRTIMRME